VGEEYSSCYSDETKTEIAKKLNMESKELEEYFTENDIKFMALGKDNKSQIRIVSVSDDFSKAVGNMSNLSKSEVKKIAQELVGDGITSFDVYENDARKFIKIVDELKDSGGEYTLTRFITVENGTLYNISFFSDEKDFSKENESILNSFKINNPTTGSSLIMTLTFVFAIAIFFAIIVIMAILIVRDARKKSE